MHTAAITTGPGTIVLESRDVGPPSPTGEVLLEVEAVGLCGTDLHIYDGSFPVKFPVVQGHEIAARVVELPPGHAGTLKVGGRVAVEPVVACGSCIACRRGAPNTCERMEAIGVQRPGGLQRYLRVPGSHCHPVGDLDARTAALAETMSVSLRAVSRANLGADDTVVILGAGPIGLGAVAACCDHGATVAVLDRVPLRLDLARGLGATLVASDVETLRDGVDQLTNGDGPTVVIEASGSPVLARMAFDLVATTGTICVVGVSEQEIAVPLRAFTRKELTVVGSRATLDFPGAVDFLQRWRDDLAVLVTHSYPIEQIDAAFRLAIDHPDQAVKVVVEPT
jgi:L-gulonate 5-dehydrogenase